jgi:hypothetical protein
LVCKSFSHSINCKYHNNNNALKGASLVSARTVNQQPNKHLIFNHSEVQILAKTLEICRLYINKNSSLFQQQPNDIVNEINQSLKILKPRNSLKGASSNKICNKTKIQSLINLKKLFSLA